MNAFQTSLFETLKALHKANPCLPGFGSGSVKYFDGYVEHESTIRRNLNVLVSQGHLGVFGYPKGRRLNWYFIPGFGGICDLSGNWWPHWKGSWQTIGNKTERNPQ